MLEEQAAVQKQDRRKQSASQPAGNNEIEGSIYLAIWHCVCVCAIDDWLPRTYAAAHMYTCTNVPWTFCIVRYESFLVMADEIDENKYNTAKS